MDKNSYFKNGNSRSDAQDFSNNSKDAKAAADKVKERLRSHNFKFGSYKQDWVSTQNDKQLNTQDPVSKILNAKQDLKINKKMYNTQSSWGASPKQSKSKAGKVMSRSQFDTPQLSFSQQINQEVMERKPELPEKGFDRNELKKSSIKFGDSGTFNDLKNLYSKKLNQYWKKDKSDMAQTLNRRRNKSPFMRTNKNILQGNFSIGGHQKSQILSPANKDKLKPLQISKDIREKDQEVHNSMKRKNIHLGSGLVNTNSVAKSSFLGHSKKEIDELNGEIPLNSNFKKSLHIGSPKANRNLESKLSMYGEQLTKEDSSAAKEMNLK